jgi:hypothetical protein
VALHTAPPNKLSHRYSGPYVITALTSGGNIATIRHVYSGIDHSSAVHISRLVPFDLSRADPADVADAQLEPGSYVVAEVMDHVIDPERGLLLYLRWHGNTVTTWESAAFLTKVAVVNAYCAARGLTIVPAAQPPPSRARAARAARR